MLAWLNHDHMIATLTAVGCRGVYSVQKIGPQWWLHGTGHDDLSMTNLPISGKPFDTLTSAQQYANELDRLVAAESHAGGE